MPLLSPIKEREGLQELQIQMQRWCLCHQRLCWNQIVMCVRSATKDSRGTKTFRCIEGGTSLITKHISKLVAPEDTLVIVVVFSQGWRALLSTKMLVTWEDSGQNLNHHYNHQLHVYQEQLQAQAHQVKQTSAHGKQNFIRTSTLHHQQHQHIKLKPHSWFTITRKDHENVVNHSTQLQLSIGSSDMSGFQEQAREHLRIAMAEKAYAEEARKQAKRQIELAEQEFTNAKRIRQQAQSELDKAYALKEHAMKQVNSTMLQITCHACKQQFQAQDHENSLVLSYMSSAITTEGGGEVENDNGKDHAKTN
ncbi:hypothetical protein SESBI_02895 [Sesbania bispinosa]|nr:hypothetical protein SESBI_02895 [Sesbania bispinosa]